MASAEKVFLPIHPPLRNYKDDPRPVLSQSEQSMYDEVLAHLTRTDPVYTIPNVEKGELIEKEKFWLSRECLLRYLRASKWKVATAIQRLEVTLKWRREYGVYDTVTAELVEPEAVTGKMISYGYDKTGKPAIYMIPSRQNTDEATRQIQFVVWMLERSVDLMEPGVETLALLINFGDRGKNPSISTALAVLNILQNHYPERLGLSLIINVPFLVNAFFKMVMPLVDPITRQKVKFNPSIFEDGFFEKDMVMQEWGGTQNFEYVHKTYWAGLVSTCDNRVKMWSQNWKNLGSNVGISEWDYKKETTTDEKHTTTKSEEDSSAAIDASSVTESVDSQPEEHAAPPKKDSAPPVLELGDFGAPINKHDTSTQATASSHSQADGHGVTAVTGAGTVAAGGSGDGGDGAAAGAGE